MPTGCPFLSFNVINSCAIRVEPLKTARAGAEHVSGGCSDLHF